MGGFGLIRKEMAVTDTTELLDEAMIDPVTGEIIDQKDLAERLLAQAKQQGVSLVGPGGLLNQLTKNVLETALEAELTEHLGHEHGGTPLGSNMRNGTRTKTVLTEIGPVEIEVTRDRDGSFEPVIVPKRKRRLDGIDQIVLSLTARGLTTGEIVAHFDEVYSAKVSKDTISSIAARTPPASPPTSTASSTSPRHAARCAKPSAPATCAACSARWASGMCATPPEAAPAAKRKPSRST